MQMQSVKSGTRSSLMQKVFLARVIGHLATVPSMDFLKTETTFRATTAPSTLRLRSAGLSLSTSCENRTYLNRISKCQRRRLKRVSSTKMQTRKKRLRWSSAKKRPTRSLSVIATPSQISTWEATNSTTWVRTREVCASQVKHLLTKRVSNSTKLISACIISKWASSREINSKQIKEQTSPIECQLPLPRIIGERSRKEQATCIKWTLVIAKRRMTTSRSQLFSRAATSLQLVLQEMQLSPIQKIVQTLQSRPQICALHTSISELTTRQPWQTHKSCTKLLLSLHLRGKMVSTESSATECRRIISPCRMATQEHLCQRKASPTILLDRTSGT